MGATATWYVDVTQCEDLYRAHVLRPGQLPLPLRLREFDS